jgi:hypothetical protein
MRPEIKRVHPQTLNVAVELSAELRWARTFKAMKRFQCMECWFESVYRIGDDQPQFSGVIDGGRNPVRSPLSATTSQKYEQKGASGKKRSENL